jgi:hypothetical protein
MKRALVSSAASLCLFLITPADGQESTQRLRTPQLSTEDLKSRANSAETKKPEDEVKVSKSRRTPVQNARAILHNALSDLAQARSLRMRIEMKLPAGGGEGIVEIVKPDRIRAIRADTEIIAIGGNVYLRSEGGPWQRTSAPAGGPRSVAGLDLPAFLDGLLRKSGARVTGRTIGDEVVDGYDTVAYEFTVSDNDDTGTIQLSIGKADGIPRRMSMVGPGIDVKVWFSSINENLSIEPPM